MDFLKAFEDSYRNISLLPYTTILRYCFFILYLNFYQVLPYFAYSKFISLFFSLPSSIFYEIFILEPFPLIHWIFTRFKPMQLYYIACYYSYIGFFVYGRNFLLFLFPYFCVIFFCVLSSCDSYFKDYSFFFISFSCQTCLTLIEHKILMTLLCIFLLRWLLFWFEDFC